MFGLLLGSFRSVAQNQFKWAPDGKGYFQVESNEIVHYSLPQRARTVIVPAARITPAGAASPLLIADYQFTSDQKKVLIFTNTRKVWRLETRGDYFLADLSKATLRAIGKGRAPSSLMFAKFSPDGKSIAYVSEYNIYTEDVSTGTAKALTQKGNRKWIFGTFDWAYEEEFFCRDGFRWSPDSRKIAFWQIDARNTKDYLMLNAADSIYPKAVPVEYPVSGESPSPARIGVVTIASASTQWMKLPSDPLLNSYLPRMEWAAGSEEVIVQHLNRKQNQSTIFLCSASSGNVRKIYEETDPAWIDILPLWDNDYINGGWDWLQGGKAFLWASEKDGWRHLYVVQKDNGKEMLVTKGDFDVMEIASVDETGGYVYFHASPSNATQRYLYRARLDGSGTAERLSPVSQSGTHDYDVSPGASFAYHRFSSHAVAPVREFISLSDHRSLEGDRVQKAATAGGSNASRTEFFTITTQEGITMDAWRVLPKGFDSSKRYPVVFYVYTEPWGQNVKDQYGVGRNFLYRGDMAEDGYIYISIDNRGTPVPKGREWRKCIYRKIGVVNIDDQASAAREIMKWPYVDTARVAVWGWSGGGSATLNLLFRYPEIYKTGISIAAVGNQLTYDNIYQERYMGLPAENKADFVKGSPITYARNLKGNLLYIHGTGDDNVHYNNCEMLVNELVKHNRQFSLMIYPNRTHSIDEGEGTNLHLTTLYTDFLKKNCPPGGLER
jgi:dipeptidyl-peptidase-4